MLVVKNLAYSFGYRKLFFDVSCRLEAGEIVHLVGGNGAGKSTFLELVAGLRSIQEGTVDFVVEAQAGSNLSYLPAEANSLFPKLDATDNLKFWLGLKGVEVSPSKLKFEMKRWGLGHQILQKNFPVGQFSTGMKRRLALLLLCLENSICWLLDEPIYGLDAKGIELFKNALSSHCAMGGGAIVISHDPIAFAGKAPKVLELKS